jgi:hypothetical protein
MVRTLTESHQVMGLQPPLRILMGKACLGLSLFPDPTSVGASSTVSIIFIFIFKQIVHMCNSSCLLIYF